MNANDTELLGRLAFDPSRVLVVSRSPINRVVMAKIVERSGLKPHAETPDTASGAMREQLPATVIVDGGESNRDCDHVIADLVALRRAGGLTTPRLILLSNRNGTPESLALSPAVDAVVSKPITTDRLQPVVDRLSGRV
jgi:CheY-like chemotaxis protein